jgi:hypothetical protein
VALYRFDNTADGLLALGEDADTAVPALIPLLERRTERSELSWVAVPLVLLAQRGNSQVMAAVKQQLLSGDTEIRFFAQELAPDRSRESRSEQSVPLRAPAH